MESKKYNKLVTITKRSRLTDIENKLAEKEWRRGKIEGDQDMHLLALLPPGQAVAWLLLCSSLS